MRASKPHIGNLLNLLCDIDFEDFMEKVDAENSPTEYFRPKITFYRLKNLRRNVSDIIEMLFIKTEANLFDLDRGLQTLYSMEDNSCFDVELRGGSIGGK